MLRIFTLIGFLLGLFATPAAAQFQQGRFDLSLEWKEIKTAHFNILFPRGYEFYGQKAALFAEDVYEMLVPIVGYTPTRKTPIILSDQHDDHNGWATVFPYPQINVRLTPPDIESSINRYENWLYATILHEYTHILNLSPAEGLYSFFRDIFGYVAIPNVTLPRWHIEGLATFTETKLTTAGRGGGPYFDMLLRSAVNENLLGDPSYASVDQLNENVPWFPRGTIIYLFGYEYWDYLVNLAGIKSISAFNMGNARRFPYTFEKQIKEITNGKDSEEIFQEIWKKLTARYQSQIKKINTTGVPPHKTIVDRESVIVSPRYSPDGKILAYIEYSPNNGGRLMFYYVHEDREVHVKEAGQITGAHRLNWSPDGNKIILSQRKKWKVMNEYRDLFEFDLKRSKFTRLTWGLRADYPVYSFDGKQIYFVLEEKGTQYLAVTNRDVSRPTQKFELKTLEGEEVEPVKNNEGVTSRKRHAVLLLKADSFERISSLSIWGDGWDEIIVFIVKDPYGKQDMWTLNLRTAELMRLTDDYAEESSPTWGMDGNYIIFTSNRDGVFNIYAIHKKSKKLIRITNVIGAALESTVFPAGNKIAATNLKAKSINLVEISVNLNVLDKIRHGKEITTPKKQEFKISSYPIKPTPELPFSEYSPYHYLFPTWWLPWVDLVEDGIRIGGITGGEDPLREWSYLLNVGYDSRNQRVNWSASIDFRRFLPIFSTSFSDLTKLISATNVFQRNMEWRSAFKWPLDFLMETTTFQPRFYLQNISFTNFPSPEILFIGFGAVLTTEKTGKFPYSVTTEKGIRFLASIDRFLATSVQNDFDYWRAIGSFSGYLPIHFPSKHSVLALRSSIGWTEGAPIDYSFFQVGGELPYVLEGKLFLLRGFDINKFLASRPFVTNLEWRIPLSQTWRGWGTFPLFLKQIYFVPFFDLGTAN